MTRNRILARAQSIARRNPVDPPLWTGADTLYVMAALIVAFTAMVAAGVLP